MVGHQGVLQGKVAIVTGARRGIGKAETKALAAEGAKVVACDLVYEDLLTVRDEIAASGGECLPLKCDVREKDQIQNVVNKTIEKYGKVDILVNNAQGGLEPVVLEEITDELVAMSLYSGPVASLRLMQACFPYMKAQKWGRIINTSSPAANGGVPNFANYAMAKGAIASLTYAAATDWSKFGVTVNVIFPAIRTPALESWMAGSPGRREALETGIPVGYLGEAEKDLGPILVFIASDASHYLTGHAFYITGGSGNGPR
jgi:3-oxoacyl-[acyl-carrier protein] reductase